MIQVLATIQLHPGKRAEFLAIFQRLVPKVQAEEGCLEYYPTIDVATDFPTQGPLREDVVVVVEQWASLEHLKAHLAAPHMVEYRPTVKHLVQGVSLQVLKPA